MTVLLVALGCAAGAVLRLLVGLALPGPRGTLAVNLSGSLLLGVLAGSLEGPALAVLGAGLCGGLTTFGTWSAEVADGGPTRATAGYASATVAGCLLACAAGLALAT